MQHTDQIDYRICLRNQTIQLDIVMDISFNYLYGGQHQQMTRTRQVARGYDDLMASRSEPRHDVRADETAAANH
jgi:hypothetical protein